MFRLNFNILQYEVQKKFLKGNNLAERLSLKQKISSIFLTVLRIFFNDFQKHLSYFIIIFPKPIPISFICFTTFSKLSNFP